MNKSGSIIIIDDDEDDRLILSEIFKKLNFPNEVVYFENGILALEYLRKSPTQPFIIITDINMPKMSGFELRDKLKASDNANTKFIPYLFFSTALNQRAVMEAYSDSAQGFFQKPTSPKELERLIAVIFKYWQNCAAPNNFN